MHVVFVNLVRFFQLVNVVHLCIIMLSLDLYCVPFVIHTVMQLNLIDLLLHKM